MPSSHNFSPPSNFVLVESEAQKYPLFRFIPYPVELSVQVALGTAVLLILLGTAYFLAAREDSLIDTLGLWLAILSREIMATVTSSVGLGGDLFGRVGRVMAGVTGSKHGSTGSWSGVDTSQAGLASRANKRSRKAMPLRRAQASAANAQQAQAKHHPGLYNTGNTCFFNSVLQALASTEWVAEYLDGITALAERWDVATPVTDALRELVAALNSADRKPSAIYPSDLSRALGQVSLLNGTRSLVGAHQQQDAHELLVLLISAIDDELSVVKAHRAEILRLSRSGLRAALPLAYLEEPASKSDPTNIFRGLIAQRTSCYRCGYTEAIRHHAFDELSLNVPQYACTLEHCIAKWEEVEEVEWVCHACSMRRTLERLSAECARLEGGKLPGAVVQELNGSAAQHFDKEKQGKMNGSASGAGEKMTASKKKRLKEMRKAEARVRMVLELGAHEDEVQEAGMLEGIKLDRTPSPSSTKHVMIARAPRLLAVHLNRSNYYGAYGASKNNAAVRFGEYLDLRPFMTNGRLNLNPDEPISEMSPLDGIQSFTDRGASSSASTEERLRHIYRLKSIVVHLGGHHFGHYIAFRQRPKASTSAASDAAADMASSSFLGGGGRQSEWLHISDERVSACSLDEVLGQTAYLLFYERVTPTNDLESALSDELPASHGTAAAGRAPPTGMENLGGPKERRIKALIQPQVVPRWSVEPCSSASSSREGTPALASVLTNGHAQKV